MISLGSHTGVETFILFLKNYFSTIVSLQEISGLVTRPYITRETTVTHCPSKSALDFYQIQSNAALHQVEILLIGAKQLFLLKVNYANVINSVSCLTGSLEPIPQMCNANSCLHKASFSFSKLMWVIILQSRYIFSI